MNKPLGTTLCLMLAAATAAVFAADLRRGADAADLKVGTTIVPVPAHVRSAGLQASAYPLNASPHRLQASQQPAVAQATTPAPAAAVLAKYCITCHNEKRKTAGLMIDKLDLQHVGADAEVWEKVARKFRTHEMPPPGM